MEWIRGKGWLGLQINLGSVEMIMLRFEQGKLTVRVRIRYSLRYGFRVGLRVADGLRVGPRAYA